MLKFLLLIALVLIVIWVMRGGRRIDVPKAPRTPQPPAPPAREDMLSCAHCGLHLPRGEALPGRGGVFCGEAHRRAYEQAHPAP
jgi:uncharacterized protein